MKQISKVWVIFLICILASGCWSSKEIENMVYIHGMAVDYIDGQVAVHVRVIDLSNIAKKESGGERGPTKIWTGKVLGKTMGQAIFELYRTNPQRFYWGHMNHILFTESALQHGLLEDTFDSITRYHEFRPTIWVFGTKTLGSASTPIFNLSPLYSRLSDPMDTYRQRSIVQPLQYFKLHTELSEPGRTVSLMGITINRKQWTESEEKKAHPTVETDGIFVIHKGTYKGWLSAHAASGIRWMQKSTVRSPLAIPSDNPQALLVLEDPEPEIISFIDSGKPKFKIRLTVSGYITEMKKTVTEKEILNQATHSIEEEIRKTYLEGLKLKADIYQLSQHLYRKNPKAWHQHIVKGELPMQSDSLESIEVKVKLISSGKLKIR